MSTPDKIIASPLVGSESVRISVIIPARNEERMLCQSLESLVRNHIPKESFEVIVVDNGSQDGTVAVAKGFEARISIRVLSLSGVHISALRNHGAAIAVGSLLAFLDADCIAPPDWLTNACGLLQDTKSGIVGAHYQIPGDATWVGRIWCEDRAAGKIGDVSYVPAGDLLMRKDVFVKLGGFDESIQTNEDLELCQRALTSGFSVKSYPALRVVHLGTPRTLLSFYRKQRWHGTHVFTVFLKDPEKRRNRRPIAFTFYTIVCLLFLLAACIWGVWSENWIFALGFLSLYLGPLLLISSARTIPQGKWSETLPLMVLYAAFGLARAESILRFRTWWGAYRKASVQTVN